MALFYEDDRPVDGKGIGRKVIDRVKETYDAELGGKDFAYDGEKSLFTVGSLPLNKMEFSVVLEETPSNRLNFTFQFGICSCFNAPEPVYKIFLTCFISETMILQAL